ncbi:hypothetical protein PPSIR1_31758 [Plesiocystis pacifica SIR-1]|uniref:VWFA domain-containing protein n=1 Tax=Plesiocystis pacifica SIR-1 TaxID=391625 RepID=A6G2R9_9BACT|nr:DUF58 domain-containing protein [Plesiocystis pacifica]EDM79769.1 hypothetical protein PPSIR1_31758 [Plesiocystis pacifica SIR-1]
MATTHGNAENQAARDRAATTELLREVRRIEIQTSRLVDQHLSGSYQSMFKGRGVAFSEVRAYEPGDDVRTIDWNVTARTGEPHVKLFSEERDLTVMLLVDMSASLDLGSTVASKRNLVARLAATFAFSAIRNNDRVGLIGFTDRVEVFVPPRSGRKHVLSVVQQILTHRPSSRRTDVGVALQTMSRLRRKHAVVILISDFIDVGLGGASSQEQRQAAAFEKALKLVRRRNDVIPVRVEDPIELELPALGLIAVEDLELLELGGVGLIDLGGRRAARYKDAVAAEREAFDKLMRRLRLETMSIRCGENWQKPLVQFFERRARRMRR